MRGVLVLLALAACGRLSFDSHGDAGNKDAPPNLDDGGVATCNAITRLADDFTIDRSAQLWGRSYTDSTSSVTIAGGTATLNIAVDAANAYVGLGSSRYYNLRGRRVYVGLVHPANANTTTGFGITLSMKTLAHVEVQNGFVLAIREVSGAYDAVAMAPYDPIAMRYLAISERGGRLYWETSRDAVTFDVLYDEPVPFDVSLVDATVFAGTANPNATPGTAVFDQFDGGTPVAGDACKAATLVDPFDGSPTLLWQNSFLDACCTDSETNGQLVLSSDGTVGYAGRRSSAGYDLRDSQIVAGTKGPQVATKLYAALVGLVDQNDYIALEMRGDGYECNAVVGGTLQQTPALLGIADAYLRIRESSGTVFYEASSDSTTWRVVATIPTPFDVSDLLVGVEIGDSTTDLANTVAFEGFNAP